MKLSTRIPRPLNEARCMLDDENDTVKLLELYNRLLATNAELVKIYGELAPRITADSAGLGALVQHNDRATDMLADSKMVLLETPLIRILQAPVAEIVMLNQERMLTTGDPRLLPLPVRANNADD